MMLGQLEIKSEERERKEQWPPQFWVKVSLRAKGSTVSIPRDKETVSVTLVSAKIAYTRQEATNRKGNKMLNRSSLSIQTIKNWGKKVSGSEGEKNLKLHKGSRWLRTPKVKDCWRADGLNSSRCKYNRYQHDTRAVTTQVPEWLNFKRWEVPPGGENVAQLGASWWECPSVQALSNAVSCKAQLPRT